MHLYPQLATAAWILVVVAIVAAVVAVATIATVVATNRRARLTRHESMRTYYGGLVLGH